MRSFQTKLVATAVAAGLAAVVGAAVAQSTATTQDSDLSPTAVQSNQDTSSVVTPAADNATLSSDSNAAAPASTSTDATSTDGTSTDSTTTDNSSNDASLAPRADRN